MIVEDRTVPTSLTDYQLLERLEVAVDVNEKTLDRVRRGAHQPKEVHDPLRNFLFGALEHLHDSPAVFARWEKQQLRHTRTCKGGRGQWEVTAPPEELAGAAWLTLREMERRVVHLNEHTIPGLGITAVARVLPVRHHVGSCTKCSGTGVGTSVTVEIMYSDPSLGQVPLRREYAL